MKAKKTKPEQTTSKPRKQRENGSKLFMTLGSAVAARMKEPDLIADIVGSRLENLNEQLLTILNIPKPTQEAVIKKIHAIVEEHLKTFVSEFPDLYRNSTRASRTKPGLEGRLGIAAKKHASAAVQCHKLLDQLETLTQSEARPLIERYDNKNADTVTHQRMDAIRRLRSVLPPRHRAANGRPVEQVKHVLAEQLKHILEMHQLPIKQSSRLEDSLAIKISRLVRDTLEFRTFDINDSLQSTRRRASAG